MPTTAASKDETARASEGEPGLTRTKSALAVSSLFFAVLQSICGLFLAVSGLRLALGITSLAFSAGATVFFSRLHGDAIRIPMQLFATLGSLLNLAVLAQIRMLRRRPASQWRMKPVSAKQLKAERVQLVLSVAALMLVVIEEGLHLHFHGKL